MPRVIDDFDLCTMRLVFTVGSPTSRHSTQGWQLLKDGKFDDGKLAKESLFRDIATYMKEAYDDFTSERQKEATKLHLVETGKAKEARGGVEKLIGERGEKQDPQRCSWMPLAKVWKPRRRSRRSTFLYRLVFCP